MACLALTSQIAPLDVLLASIPSLPRPLLARLTTRMIERLDEIDGDPDSEPDDEDEEHDGSEPEEGDV